MVAVLAFDLGASSGRAILGWSDHDALNVREVHRFGTPTRSGPDGSLYWDIDALMSEIEAGLRLAARHSPLPLASVGVDTWGVDYGYLDAAGELIGDPHSYRDPRASRHADRFWELLSPKECYRRSGIEPNTINTSMQMFADLACRPELRERVTTALFMPDLLHYLLGAPVTASQTISSTSGLTVAGGNEWDLDTLATLGIPTTWLPAIEREGRIVGHTSNQWSSVTGERLAIVAAGTHDTAAAVQSLGPDDRTSAFISCGTWSLVGRQTDAPVFDNPHLTNEVGVEGQTLLMRNLTGLWLLQECQRTWAAQHVDRSLSSLLTAAANAPGRTVLLDLADPKWAVPGDMPDRIAACVRAQSPSTACSEGLIVRIILDSLATAYADAIDELERATGTSIKTIRMVGGGARNSLLCQLTAQCTGKEVTAGPFEASAIGNIRTQLHALGEFDSAMDTTVTAPIGGRFYPDQSRNDCPVST